MRQKEALKELQRIPGVGPRLSEDLYRLGFRTVAELADDDPQIMYERLIALEGRHVDRCVLYVFRCAVHFATHDVAGTVVDDPALLQWWNWKD